MTTAAAPLVLGGGPAGSMCALNLARAGRQVTLLEKSKESHDKVCGDFLSRESVFYLQRHGLHPQSLGAVPVRRVRVVTRGVQQESVLPFPAWSLSRRTLDEALLQAAADAGVEVVRGAHVTALQPCGTHWQTTLRDGRAFTAGDVVLATGKLDVSGWPRPEGAQPHLVAFKMYFRLTETQQHALGDAVELILYPGGYTGLERVEGGAANLTVLLDGRRLRSIGAHWSAVLDHLLAQSPHLRQRLHGALPLLDKPLAASRIPYGHLQRTTQDGLWRVGDQAAVIPSLCGDGTAIALHSGALAATWLLRGERSTAYQRRLHSQLAMRLRFATGISRLLVSKPAASNWLRVVPGLLRTVASATRIPDSALCEAC